MDNNQTNWTVLSILNTTTDFFRNRSIENPRLNAERLLAHILNTERIQLYLQFERILTENEINVFRELVRRRTHYEPLQYLIGYSEFMGMPFKVSPAVLIPRPETELLVERTLLLKEKFTTKETWIWDIGTGCGCIAISLANFWPETRIIATDITAESLEIAIKNAEMNNTAQKINFIRHDILHDDLTSMKNIDIIVSNPPYVSKAEYEKLDPEIREYEPEIAITDYENGIVFYHKILSLIGNAIDCKFVLLELSGTCVEEILEIPKQYGIENVNIINDLNNLPRILEINI
jgi:release factor glutamine methyltransferase